MLVWKMLASEFYEYIIPYRQRAFEDTLNQYEEYFHRFEETSPLVNCMFTQCLCNFTYTIESTVTVVLIGESNVAHPTEVNSTVAIFIT